MSSLPTLSESVEGCAINILTLKKFMNSHTNIFGISLFLIGLLFGLVPCQNIHAQIAVSSSTHAGSLITLEEVTGGAFYDRFTGARIMPFPGDGDMYTSISRDGRKINLYSYKTGKEVS